MANIKIAELEQSVDKNLWIECKNCC